jgi:hypothetical protein
MSDLIANKDNKSNEKLAKSKNLQKQLKDWCATKTKSKYSLELITPKIKLREKKVNCGTFHTAGICVPVDGR